MMTDLSSLVWPHQPGATSNTIIDVISPHPALAYTIMGLHGPSESLNVGYSTGKRFIPLLHIHRNGSNLIPQNADLPRAHQ